MFERFKDWRLPRLSFERWYFRYFAMDAEIGPYTSFSVCLFGFRVYGWIGHAEGCECDRCLPF